MKRNMTKKKILLGLGAFFAPVIVIFSVVLLIALMGAAMGSTSSNISVDFGEGEAYNGTFTKDLPLDKRLKDEGISRTRWFKWRLGQRLSTICCLQSF